MRVDRVALEDEDDEPPRWQRDDDQVCGGLEEGANGELERDAPRHERRYRAGSATGERAMRSVGTDRVVDAIGGGTTRGSAPSKSVSDSITAVDEPR
jgi:hypothetical protein